jgi:flavin reductase (DIM6/NTAB) family NADH-FMN oxidoreductase RutF
MSSFTSLTLTPTPLVTFNVKTPSRTLDAISSSRHFNIHILAADETGVRVADHFTRGNVEGKGLWGLKFEVAEGESMPPTLTEEGVMYVLRCKLFDETEGAGMVSVRDHVMVVGEVVEVVDGVDGYSERDGTEFGLAYADRKYRGVGGVISARRDDVV